MDWHIRLAEVAPGYRMVRLLFCWVLYDPKKNYLGKFRHWEQAMRHAVAHRERTEQ